ncbi:MAG TPA: septal ring lytic transglycosylase RlpA family protein [Myxococcales bacterium]|nr:septal ring lytic transglycosylase RlpA family protein [Myxococcales bacterium]
MRLVRSAAVLGVLAACAKAPVAPTPPPPEQAPRRAPVQDGMASYYGARFAGRLTASGERFDPRALTAAHPELPFGTRVRVTNLDNGRSITVRINDRGPFASGRIVDLSWEAARVLDMLRRGVARVRLEVLQD